MVTATSCNRTSRSLRSTRYGIALNSHTSSQSAWFEIDLSSRTSLRRTRFEVNFEVPGLGRPETRLLYSDYLMENGNMSAKTYRRPQLCVFYFCLFLFLFAEDHIRYPQRYGALQTGAALGELKSIAVFTRTHRPYVIHWVLICFRYVVRQKSRVGDISSSESKYIKCHIVKMSCQLA